MWGNVSLSLAGTAILIVPLSLAKKISKAKHCCALKY